MSESSSEYSEVTEMVRHLRTLAVGSAAFQRQRDAIVKRCLPLADHIARRYGGRGEPIDDLVQAARLGLVNAVNRFDVDNGADFVSFAVPTMMGEVRRHFRDHGWAVNVPRRVKELQPWFHGDYKVILLDGTELTLSRSYRPKLKNLLGESI